MNLHTTYFGSVDWYGMLLRAYSQRAPEQQEIADMIDAEERYVKQTSRNRCEIATANGKQILTVPVSTSSLPSLTSPLPPLLTKDVLISEHGNWRHHHWEALKSAYGMSPFFDYYQDDIYPFFDEQTFHDNHWEHLYDYNLAIIRKILELLGVANVTSPTPYLPSTSSLPTSKEYYQTFQRRQGFIPGLSILDLLFNEGPSAILYL